MDDTTETPAAAELVDFLRCEAATALQDLAYAVGQLRPLADTDRVRRALDGLERVEELLKGITTHEG